MYKVLIKLYVPMIDEKYDLWLPLNKRVYNVILLLTKAIDELSGGYYKPEHTPMLYDKMTGAQYDISVNVKEAGIINGMELILM